MKRSQPARRQPRQTRSKERVNLIRNAAKKLIGKRGIDNVSMRQIAKHARVQIGSIYQYFPDKSALVRSIAQEYFDLLYGFASEALAKVSNADDILGTTDAILVGYVNLFKTDKALSNLFRGLQAMPELRDFETRDTMRNARLVEDTIVRVSPGSDRAEVHAFSVYLSYTVGEIIRFTFDLATDEGEAVLREMSRIISLRLQALFRGSLEKETVKKKRRV